MQEPWKVITDEIIKKTLNYGDLKEVEITKDVSKELKKLRLGMFQNEVDYKVLFPSFTPSEDLSQDKFVADLVGFTQGELSLVEFKVYDENIKTKNPWGVLHYFISDRRKLEAAIEQNTLNLSGYVIQICAIRNTDFEKNIDHSNLLCSEIIAKPDKKPSIKGARFFPILDALKMHTFKESKVEWQYHEISKKSAYVAFLIGVAKLNTM